MRSLSVAWEEANSPMISTASVKVLILTETKNISQTCCDTVNPAWRWRDRYLPSAGKPLNDRSPLAVRYLWCTGTLSVRQVRVLTTDLSALIADRVSYYVSTYGGWAGTHHIIGKVFIYKNLEKFATRNAWDSTQKWGNAYLPGAMSMSKLNNESCYVLTSVGSVQVSNVHTGESSHLGSIRSYWTHI